MSYNWNNKKQIACTEYMNLLDSIDGFYTQPVISKLYSFHNHAYSYAYQNKETELLNHMDKVNELLGYQPLFSETFRNKIISLLYRTAEEARKAAKEAT